MKNLIASFGILLSFYSAPGRAASHVDTDPVVCTIHEDCDDSVTAFILKTTSEKIDAVQVGDGCGNPLKTELANEAYDKLQGEAKQLVDSKVCTLTLSTIVAAPTNLTVTAAADQMTLSWDFAPSHVSPAPKFTVWRENYTGGDQQDNWKIIANDVTGNTYQDKGLAYGSYIYRVQASASDRKTDEITGTTTGVTAQAIVRTSTNPMMLYVYSVLPNDKFQILSPFRNEQNSDIPWMDLPVTFPAQGAWKTVAGLNLSNSPFAALAPMTDDPNVTTWSSFWAKTTFVTVRRLNADGSVAAAFLLENVSHL